MSSASERHSSVQRTDAARTIVEAAKTLAPVLIERSDEANRLRRMPDATWKELIDGGILRALQPARWGGGEVHLGTFCEAIAEVARADGSAGWVAGIIGVHPWQVASFPAETQNDLWAKDPSTINSSSYAATGKAVKVSGGYRLDGRWSFSTGCDHCEWVVLGAVAGTAKVEGKDLPDLRSFLLPRVDYRIDDNWFVAGLAGTGSKDIVVEDTFVPAHRSQSHWDYALGVPLPGWELNPAPLYRLSFGLVFNYALTASVLGAARGFLDLWTSISRTRKGGYGLNVKEDPFTQRLFAEVSYAIDTGMLAMRRNCDQMMDAARAGARLALKDRAAIRYGACRSAQLAVRAVDRLFEASSGRAIFVDHPLQRRYQDVKAMIGHAYLNADAPAKLYGASEFGVPVLDATL